MTVKKVPELARETLKQLVARRLAPTPGNYQQVFNELAGMTSEPPFPQDQLRRIAQNLPARTPGQNKYRGLLESAINQNNWQGVHDALMGYGDYSPRAVAETSLPAASGVTADRESSAMSAAVRAGSVAAPALTNEFLEQIARLIEYARPALGSDDSRFVEQTQELLGVLRQPDTDLVRVKQLLSTFGHRVSFAAEDQAEIKSTLLHLLHLILENISELSVDDRWLKGQVDALMSAATPPITLRRLDDVERKLRDVLLKQSEAKGRAIEAQAEMRAMLGAFIERLSAISSTTSDYGSKMEENARLIEQAKTFEELTPVLKEVVAATRNMASNTLTARDELTDMRTRAEATEAEIAKLHKELDRVSAQARHDPLTGALNRKGLDEALNRELSTMRRKDTPLCVALLDIDNFKKINDSLGHATGDQALAHLAQVARDSMRPQDTLARYGGEEFVILLPDTALDKGIEAMTRLQRELSRKFFLAGTEKVLITFSAGVAQVGAEEDSADAIKRADGAMYTAKRSGKNRVFGA